MKRLIKWIAGIAGTLVVLLVIAMVAVAVLVDPNDYKEQIAVKVKEQTGRELVIAGDIGLSFFPWLGLELGRMELGNAEGFGPEPFAAIDAVDAKVKILPLLRTEVEMDTVVLHGLRLSLTRRADGTTNWDDLAGGGKVPAPADAEKPAAEKPAEAQQSPLAALAIGGIEVRDANVSWNDEMAGQQLVLSDFNLTSGAISFEAPFPLNLDGKVSLSKPALKASIDLATRIGLDLPQQQYRMLGTRLAVDAEGEVVPGGRVKAELGGDFSADLKQQTASVKGLTLNGMGVSLEGGADIRNLLAMPAAEGSLKLVLADPKGLESLVALPPELDPAALKGSTVEAVFSVDPGEAQTLSLNPLTLDAMGLALKVSVDGEQIIDAPRFRGELASEEFVPRDLIAAAGVALPEMADPSAMTRAKLSSRFEAGLDDVALQGLELQFDDTTLSGEASVKQFKAPVIRYQLAVDGIDADRYLPPPSEKPAQKPAAAGSGGSAEAAPVALPLELMRSLDIDGTLKVGKVKVMNLHSDSIVATVRALNGQFRVHPLTANLYQGGYSGDLSLDVRNDTPALGMNEKLSGVQAGPLLKDFLGKDYVTGSANVSAKMTARGLEPDAVKRSLNGVGSFSFDDGQVKGFNIGHLIRKAYALYKKQPAPEEEVRQTDFTALGGSFRAKNGVITTSDLAARSPLFQVDGKGSANLVKEKVDMRLETTVVSSLKDAAKQDIDELKGVMIPVTIKGSFSDPKFGVDVGSVLEAKARAELEKKKKEAEAKAKKRIDKEKKKIEKDLQNKLKDVLKF